MSEPGLFGFGGSSEPGLHPMAVRDSTDDRVAMARALVLGGLVVALALATQLFPKAYPLGVVLLGALLGTGTGLLAVGLVLTYRTTRIINFSYGALGTLAASVAAGLKLGQDWPWTAAALAGLLVGVLTGALVERVVIRRFTRAPRLILTVATIGLAQLFGGVAYYMPDWLGDNSIVTGFSTRFDQIHREVGSVTFDGNDLLLLAAVPVVLGGLSWFLLRTDAGMAVRGMAENMERARLLGIPVNQLSLLLWSVAGGLAALSVVLRVPNEGLPLEIGAGPEILLPALAAAVVSGMHSLTGAFAAGVALGILRQLVEWNFPDQRAIYLVVFLLVILVALLLQPRPAGRALAGEESSWATVARARKLPRHLSRLPEVRLARAALLGIVVLVVLGLPLVGRTSQVNFGTTTLVYGLAALSLVVLTGWGGVVSLGQVGLVGVGSVVVGNLVVDRTSDLFVALGAAAVAGGVVALVIGLPALRVSGQFLAVTTLAFAVAMDRYFLNPANFEAWLPADIDRPQLWGVVDLSDERWLYLFVLALVGVAALVVANLRAARAGRSIAATRDNPRAAAAVGLNTVGTRLTGFVIAGIFAGLAGGLHAIVLGGLAASTYPASASLLLFSMAVIGGSSSIGGTLAGVAVVQWVGYLFPRAQLLLAGVGLLVILLLLPGGLSRAFEDLRDRFAVKVARRRRVPARGRQAPVAAPTAPPTPIDTGELAILRGGSGLLTCEGVESSYGSMQVLFGIDTVVGRGELLALLGTNGAGKSTLLRSVAGLLPPDRGRITFAGQDITGWPPERIARLGLSLMPGGRGIFPTLTVAENLRLAGWLLRRDRKAAGSARRGALSLFPVLRERWDQLAGDLSGGEQQQLSLAMAFVTRPQLLCIDELSLGLAPTIVGQLIDKVKEIHRSGTAVVVVEQSVNVALLLCERAVFLEKGQVRFRGPTAGLLQRPDVLRAVFLGGAAGLHTPTGRADRRSRGVTLECRGLTKRFGGIRAVDGVDLMVPPASIVGLIGHNGAGKTTLFDLMTGFVSSDSGQVLLGGRDVTGEPPHRRAIKSLGRSFQEALLYPSLTVAEALAVALECHLRNRDPVAAALHLPAATVSERAARARVEQLVELLGLAAYRDHPTGELSTGIRRIVELGCLLAHDPAVVLLDEPSAGMAQRETEALSPVLRQIQAEAGCSLVVIEHDMALLSSLCDALVALEQGAVIAWGAPQDVLADQRVVASYLGTDHELVQRSGPFHEPGALARQERRSL